MAGDGGLSLRYLFPQLGSYKDTSISLILSLALENRSFFMDFQVHGAKGGGGDGSQVF